MINSFYLKMELVIIKYLQDISKKDITRHHKTLEILDFKKLLDLKKFKNKLIISYHRISFSYQWFVYLNYKIFIYTKYYKL